MASNQKKKAGGGARNDSRANGKASKKNPGRAVTGSRGGRMDEGFLILLGKGMMKKTTDRAHREELNAKRNSRKRSNDSDS